ncbi:hypothetical protein Tsubulata_043549 [Turnera subulata]|uniref:Cytochrome P450 n=1 Tax=Turnera subulata TaxID=218843 RepID=A0A9Q0FNV3_9ROSI|nr:hypothetical protein Tsubulata_043549 [Turnera subulata]
MEAFYKSFLLCFLVLILYALTRLAYTTWLRPKRLEKLLRQQGIKGRPYKFLLGDVKEMAKMSEKAMSKPITLNHQIIGRVMPLFHEMVQIYGKISLGWIKTTPMLVIADAELVRLVLTDKSGRIVKRRSNPFVRLLHRGVASLEGEAWATRRRSITPAFQYEKLKAMIPQFSTSSQDLICRWKKLVSHQGSFELDVAPEFQVLAGDVIARTAFGSSYEEGKKIFKLQKEQANLVHEAFFSFYFPGLRFLPTKKNKRRYSIDTQIKTTLRNIIHMKEEALRNEDSDNANDLLSLLLRSKAQADNELTIDDVIEECKLFYFAGQETTANLLTWTLVLLSMHPNWQEKARGEVLHICGKRIPDIDDINRLKIVSMVLNEVLRLYPPVVRLLRHTLKETNLQGMTIPAGVDLVLLFMSLHHDPNYWGDDAAEFRPERFAEGISKASNDQTAFYPFGWGPRICLGQNFAAIEAKMALAMILQNFWFELSPSYAHAPYTVITLQPQHGAPIILHQL